MTDIKDIMIDFKEKLAEVFSEPLEYEVTKSYNTNKSNYSDSHTSFYMTYEGKFKFNNHNIKFSANSDNIVLRYDIQYNLVKEQMVQFSDYNMVSDDVNHLSTIKKAFSEKYQDLLSEIECYLFFQDDQNIEKELFIKIYISKNEKINYSMEVSLIHPELDVRFDIRPDKISLDTVAFKDFFCGTINRTNISEDVITLINDSFEIQVNKKSIDKKENFNELFEEIAFRKKIDEIISY